MEVAQVAGRRNPWDKGRGMTVEGSTVVHVRMSKGQQKRLAAIADQAGMPLGQLLREVLEMATVDPVNVVRGLVAVRRGGKVVGYTLDQEGDE